MPTDHQSPTPPTHEHSSKPGIIDTLVPDNTLYVISVISNPLRFGSRVRLFREFQQHVQSFQGAQLVTVEAAFGDRAFEVTSSDTPFDVQVRMSDELWIKENLINLGIARLPPTWKYVAWVDGDIRFNNPDWVAETVHQLQHYPVVQMFHNAADMGPNGQIMEVHTGFGYQLVNNTLSYLTTLPGKTQPLGEDHVYAAAAAVPGAVKGAYAHSGYAWAATKDAINTMGGLPEFCIVGSGDHHIALSLIGRADLSIPGTVTSAYSKAIFSFQDRCSPLKHNVGFVEGTIMHAFHGKKKDRKYVDRWKIITDNNFDPYTDIWKDWQGVYQLSPQKWKLRDDLRAYFRSRNEDSIDL